MSDISRKAALDAAIAVGVLAAYPSYHQVSFEPEPSARIGFGELAYGGGSAGKRWSRHNVSIQDDQLDYLLGLRAGTWEADIRADTRSDAGIVSIQLDGAEVATIDLYSAVDTSEVLRTSASFDVTDSGLKVVRFKIADKNPSSAGYYAILNSFTFRRTA